MKKIWWTELLKSFAKNIVLYGCISLILAVTVAVFVSIRSTTVSMRSSMNVFLRENGMHDYHFANINGFTEEDLGNLSKNEAISYAEGSYRSDIYISVAPSVRMVIRCASLMERINAPKLTEGRLPLTKDECLIDERLEDEGYTVGDTIAVETAIGGIPMLNAEHLTICGIAYFPEEIANARENARGMSALGDGEIDATIYLTQDAFVMHTLNIGYTDIYAIGKLEGSFFSDSYKEDSMRQVELFRNEFDSSWIIRRASDNIGVRAFDELSANLESLALSMSVPFIIISMLLCYTSVSRIIFEAMGTIGMQRAYGFKSREVGLKYLLSATLLSAVPGFFIGIFAGVFIVVPIIYTPYSSILVLKSIDTIVEPLPVAIIVIVILICISLAVFFSFRKISKARAIDLIKNDTPNGKSIALERLPFIWKRLPFITQLSLRDAFRNKTKYFTGVSGYVGCCLLLVLGFTTHEIVAAVPDVQYNEVRVADMQLIMEPTASLEARQILEARLEENNIGFRAINNCYTCIVVDKNYAIINMISSPDSRLDGFLQLTDAYDAAELEIPREGALLSKKTAMNYGFSVGDTIEVMKADGSTCGVRIEGIVNNYINGILVMSSAYHEEIFGYAPNSPQYYINAGDMTTAELADLLDEMEGVVTLEDSTVKRKAVGNILQSINVVVAMVTVMALIITATVVLNMVVMQILSKEKRLKVMRALGFSKKMVKSYVKLEMLWMAIPGLALGVVAGSLSAIELGKIIEPTFVLLIKEPKLFSCALGVAVSILFSVTVNLIALRKIDKMDITKI